MPLKLQWPFVWLLVFLIPLRDVWALPATGGTLPQHLLWPLVHANILHWLINTFCFMTLWRFITIPRLVIAYLASILIGYFYTQLSTFNFQLLMLCGFSCIIFFILGIIFVGCTRTYRLRLTLLVIISCFIPGIASSVHIMSLILGLLYSRCQRFTRSRAMRFTRMVIPLAPALAPLASFGLLVLLAS